MNVYTSEQLESALPKSLASALAIQVREASPEPITNAKVRAAMVSEARRALGAYATKIAKGGTLEEIQKATKIRLLIKGESFSDGGSRNATLHSLASTVAFKLPELPEEVLQDLFADSLAAMKEERPDDPEFGNPEEMLSRALRERKARLRQEAEERIKAQTERDAVERQRNAPITDAPAVQRTLSPLYSEEQVKACIAQQAALAGVVHTAASFLSCLCVRMPTGDTVYCYSVKNGDYVQMTTGASQAWLRREVRRFPEFLFSPTKDVDGEQVQKEFDEVLTECTSVADEKNNEGGPCVGRTDIQCSYFDPVRRQFVRAWCPLRDLPAEQSEAFEEYLAAALPDEGERERLRDHLVATLNLAFPSSGVRIQGPARCGKSMIVEALARNYGVTGSTQGNLFHDHFNDWTNPIIHHEEKPSMDEHGNPVDAATHREVQTRNRHVINQKGARQIVVTGYIRQWFTENGDRMFASFSGENAAELAATAERLDSFEFTDAATEWLEARGGREFARDWIEQDVIAKHARWLAAERGIMNAGSRMMVPGREKSLKLLQSQDRQAGRILDAVCRYILKPSIKGALTQEAPPVVVGEGKVFVKADKLLDLWSELMPFERKSPPDQSAILNVIRRHAIGKASTPVWVKVRKEKVQRRYWSIQPSVLLAHMEATGLDDVDQVKEAIDKVPLKEVA